MAKVLVNFLHTASLLALIASLRFHFTSSNPTGFSIKMIPRDSPESPLYPGNLSQSQRLERLVSFSEARAQYLEYRLSSLYSPKNVTSVSTNDAKMTLIRKNFYYVALLTLGTPPTLVYLIMDSGGGLIWTQCLPCVKCFEQTVPLLDSRTSLTYRKLDCRHFLCNGGPQSRFVCVKNQCVYSVTYGGGSGPTRGVASVETIHFFRRTGAVQSLDGVVFGCSNENINFPNFEKTSISGVMGLSWSPDSLASQLAIFVNRRFSYCLTAFDKDHGPNDLTFGDAIPAPAGQLKTTKFVSHAGSGNYYFYLNLLDISVGWEPLGFPPGTFTLNPDGSGGAIIDSGAPVSMLCDRVLPNGRNPFKEVIGSFQAKYDSLKYLKRTDRWVGALCYELPDPEFNFFLTMTYHFEGADYVVEGKYVNYVNREDGFFCVALLGSSFSLLGALHQQNKRIIYDGNFFGMQFVDEDCHP